MIETFSGVPAVLPANFANFALLAWKQTPWGNIVLSALGPAPGTGLLPPEAAKDLYALALKAVALQKKAILDTGVFDRDVQASLLRTFSRNPEWVEGMLEAARKSVAPDIQGKPARPVQPLSETAIQDLLAPERKISQPERKLALEHELERIAGSIEELEALPTSAQVSQRLKLINALENLVEEYSTVSGTEHHIIWAKDLLNLLRSWKAPQKPTAPLGEFTPLLRAPKVPAKNHSMYYNASKGETVIPDYSGPILTLAERGLRTSTTRSYPLGKVGDFITFEGRPTVYMITGTHRISEEDLRNPLFLAALSQTEGWTVHALTHKFSGQIKPGAWVTYYKKTDVSKQTR